MRAYLAGPMRGDLVGNFRKFDVAAEFLRETMGIEVVSPAEMDRAIGFDPVDDTLPEWFSVEEALRRDFDALARCGAIILLPGWYNSEGARAELKLAIDFHKDLYFLRETSHYRPDDLRQLPLAVAHRQLGKLPAVVAAAPAECAGNGTGAEKPADAAQATTGANGEVRVVDPVTGGAKGQKSCQLGAIDPLALLALGEVAGFGTDKYDRFNFLKGYRWSLSADALFRHLLAFLGGEDTDPESGQPHTAHAAWHALALTSFLLRDLGKDDRPCASSGDDSGGST